MTNRRLSQLINELGNIDAKVADEAGHAIIALGNNVTPVLLQSFGTSSSGVKRRIAFLLGELGRRVSESEELQTALVRALNDDDWKVRRNSAIALSKIGDDSSIQSIVNSLKVETDPRVRTSLILTFGKLAAVNDVPLLQKIQFTSDEERLAAQKVTDRFSVMMDSVPAIDIESNLASNVPVELWSRAGVADIVALEAATMNLEPTFLSPERVKLKNPKTLKHLLQIRTALFPVLVLTLPDSHASPLQLGKELDASAVVAEMIRLTKGMPVGYRLSVKSAGLMHHHKRRDWISQFVAGCKKLANRATGYSWELFVRSVDKSVQLAARPAACHDDRFAYRKLDVPASVHPTLAAAAVRLAAPQATDLIVDPFCGSGTLLAERALLAPYSQLIGIDIDRKALHAAEINLANFDRVQLIQTDFSSITTHAPVDAVITNPPYGIRVGTESAARAIHARIDQLAAETLRPNGVLIVFRPPKFPSPRALRVLERKPVDAGGLQVDILVARK